MRKRIHESITRREMKQIITCVKPDTLQAFKLYCKAKGSSMNKEIEDYITEVSKAYTKPAVNQSRLTYEEQVKIIEQETIDYYGFNPFQIIRKSQK